MLLRGSRGSHLAYVAALLCATVAEAWGSWGSQISALRGADPPGSIIDEINKMGRDLCKKRPDDPRCDKFKKKPKTIKPLEKKENKTEPEPETDMHMEVTTPQPPAPPQPKPAFNPWGEPWGSPDNPGKLQPINRTSAQLADEEQEERLEKDDDEDEDDEDDDDPFATETLETPDDFNDPAAPPPAQPPPAQQPAQPQPMPQGSAAPRALSRWGKGDVQDDFRLRGQ